MNAPKVVLYFVILQFSIAGLLAQPAKPFYQMNKREIDQVIRELSKKQWTPAQKINYISEYFLGTPYNLTCVGDGPYALYETMPLVNFKETNCMAFCEHVLALSVSDNWENFFNNLQQIRYRDGIIGMKTRNHYTMADWLPQNHWLLKDASAEVGGQYTKKVTRTISHKTFFAGKGITDTTDVLPDRTITINYVPLDYLDEVEDNTQAGDICAILFANMDNIFSAHMFMVVENKGKKFIRESSNSKMSTFDTPYDQWVKTKQEKYGKKYLGVSFMRVKAKLNKPGFIIKPWKIADMRKRN